jgi:DNA-binding transcriptional LysR family regulator
VDLRQLRYFLMVADEGNFTRAAERLYMSQPPLSLQIMRLERELGVTLLDRTTRGVRLTPAGEVLYGRGSKLVESLLQIIADVKRVGGAPGGQLRIGYPGTAGPLVGRFLARLTRQHPDLRIALHPRTSEEQVNMLKRFELDMALLRTTGPEQLEIEGIEHYVIAEERLVAVVPAGDPLAVMSAVGLDQLLDRPLIAFPRSISPAVHDYLAAAYTAAGVAPDARHIVENPTTMLDLIEAGIGVGVLMAEAAEARRQVVAIPLKEPAPHLIMAMAWRQGDESPNRRAALSVLLEELEVQASPAE